MKKLILMAASAALIFASCAKNEGTGLEPGRANVVVKISGVKAAKSTRATGSAGSQGELELNGGTIFIINALNEVEDAIALNLNPTPVGPGVYEQVIEDISTASRIYIIGNIPSDITVADLETWADIQAAASHVVNNADYTIAALANSDGALATISVTGEGAGETEISLSPLYSRMELVKIKGGTNITSFKVAGVYVDDYFAEFTMTGAEEGDQYHQLQAGDFTTPLADLMGDNTGWDSTTGASPVATAGTNLVWNYHMAGAGLPRFIIHLSEVSYMAEDPDNVGSFTIPATVTEDRYITVAGYQGADAPNAFERGKIYRVGGVSDGITFQLEDLGTTPNPANVDLTVQVEVVDWQIEDLDPMI